MKKEKPPNFRSIYPEHVWSYYLSLLQTFAKCNISGTCPFTGAYTHYNKTYMESYNRLTVKVLKHVCHGKFYNTK